MRPVARKHAKTGDPVNPLPARCAVKNESAEFAFKIGLHVQTF